MKVSLDVGTAALAIVAGGAFLRGVVVLGAMARTALARKRFVRFQMGWAEWATVPEAFLLLAFSVWLYVHPPTAPNAAAAWSGAVVVVSGWGLLLWTFFSWPEIYAGHGVLEDHRLVTQGAYAVVRHPVYLGAFVIWIGLALGYQSLTGALATALYVIPSYLLYIRSEEAMMVECFGDEYRAYRRRVPMLIPRVRCS